MKSLSSKNSLPKSWPSAHRTSEKSNSKCWAPLSLLPRTFLPSFWLHSRKIYRKKFSKSMRFLRSRAVITAMMSTRMKSFQSQGPSGKMNLTMKKTTAPARGKEKAVGSSNFWRTNSSFSPTGTRIKYQKWLMLQGFILLRFTSGGGTRRRNTSITKKSPFWRQQQEKRWWGRPMTDAPSEKRTGTLKRKGAARLKQKLRMLGVWLGARARGEQ